MLINSAKKILLGVFTIVIICALFYTKSFAYEKTASINLTKDYESCTFALEFDNSGEYNAIIISPKGEEYDFFRIDDTHLSCNIEKAKVGSYSVVITSDDDADFGQVKASVSASATAYTDVVDDIKVSKDISNLTIYFKDDSICAEWTDESVGTVSITTVNVDTNQILDTKSVGSEKYYEFELPSDVKTVMLSIVPSTSSSVSGAAKQFTYTVDNYPNAIVSFTEDAYWNKESLPVNVTLNESYGILVLNNGVTVLKEDDLSVGEHSFDIPLSDGNNEILFYIVDNEGNMRSTSKSIVRDTIAPTLTLDKEYDGIKTTEEALTISGTIKGESTFMVNGSEYMDIASDGHFDVPIDLHLGENQITLYASDLAGNEISYVINAEMYVEKTDYLGVTKRVASLLLIIFGLIGYFQRKRLLSLFDKKIKSAKEEEMKDKMPEKQVTVKKDEEVLDEIVLEEASLNIKDNVDNDKAKEVPIKRRKFHLSTINHMPKDLYIVKLSVLLIVLFLFLHFVISIGIVVSASMESTIMTNDIDFTLQKYFVSEYQRGDIIAFKMDNELVTKRIIGVGGDVITSLDGYVYINGTRLDESAYLDSDVETNFVETYIVPEGTYFVLGDNRIISYDSRYWDNPYLNEESITGKIIWHLPTHKFLHIY